jgi:hypothetical protein
MQPLKVALIPNPTIARKIHAINRFTIDLRSSPALKGQRRSEQNHPRPQLARLRRREDENPWGKRQR